MKPIDNKLIAKTFYTFFVNGFTALMIGAILPFMMNDYQIDYKTAGIFLSLHSIGNLFASFVIVAGIQKLGRKKAIVYLSSLLALSYFGIMMTGQVHFLFLLFFLTGLGRGSISNVNNAVIIDSAAGKPAISNLLHTFFAVGAFITPLAASFIIGAGFGWKAVVLIGVLFSVSAVICYSFMDIDIKKETKGAVQAEQTAPYYKNADFYIAALLLFFYLGVETSVNGWLVTYFKNAGIVSAEFSQMLLSLIWIVIIMGRLATVFFSKTLSKPSLILINTTGACLFAVFLLNSTDIRVITVSVALFGFFLGGIYPTTIASVGDILKASPAGMAVLLAIAGLGGILMPLVIGFVAQHQGIEGGMGLILADILITLLFAGIVFARRKKREV